MPTEPQSSSGAGDQDEIPPDAVWELSPQGRAIWDRFIAECSSYAGRQLQPGDIAKVMKAVRQEMGTDTPDFSDQKVMDCFYKHLRGPVDQ